MRWQQYRGGLIRRLDATSRATAKALASEGKHDRADAGGAANTPRTAPRNLLWALVARRAGTTYHRDAPSTRPVCA